MPRHCPERPHDPALGDAERVAGTKEFVEWVAASLPKSTYINIMHQYHVDYKAFEYPEICRGISSAEYLEAIEWAEPAGSRTWIPAR